MYFIYVISRAARYRQSTGIVWQGCDKLEKCPPNNKATVLMELKGQNAMVSDAFDEITEVCNNIMYFPLICRIAPE